MTITAIKQQARLKGRYSVYIDSRYAFSLSVDALLAERLVIGQELDAAQLQLYKKLSVDDRAYNLALSYVVRRMRSQYELTEYCRRKGYSDELARRIIRKLKKLGFVDDDKFAEAWVRNRRLLKTVSKRRLAQELRKKKVADDSIAKALVEDEVDERTVLRRIIIRRRQQSRYQDTLKLRQYLIRQGFQYDDIKATLAEDI